MLKKRVHLLTGFLFLSIALVAAGCGGSGNNNTAEATKGDDKKVEVEELVDVENNPVNYDNFKAVPLSGSLEDATNLLGDGEKLEGIEGAEVYTWRGNGLANMVITLRDGQIVEKNQADLDGMVSEVTAAQAQQITPGMTIENVNAMIGEGALVKESLNEDTTLQAYEWKHANGATLSVLAENNVVVDHTAIGLP